MRVPYIREFYENIRLADRSHLAAYQNAGNTSQQTSARHHHSFVSSWMTFCDTAMTIANGWKRLPLNENSTDINTSTKNDIRLKYWQQCLLCIATIVEYIFVKGLHTYIYIYLFSRNSITQKAFSIYKCTYYRISWCRLNCTDCQPYCKTSIRVVDHVTNKVRDFLQHALLCRVQTDSTAFQSLPFNWFRRPLLRE